MYILYRVVLTVVQYEYSSLVRQQTMYIVLSSPCAPGLVFSGLPKVHVLAILPCTAIQRWPTALILTCSTHFTWLVIQNWFNRPTYTKALRFSVQNTSQCKFSLHIAGSLFDWPEAPTNQKASRVANSQVCIGQNRHKRAPHHGIGSYTYHQVAQGNPHNNQIWHT